MTSEEAAYWYFRCVDERSMPLADRRKLVEWLKHSPDNIAELLRIAGDMEELFDGRKLLDRIDAWQESNVIEADFGGGAPQRDYQPSESVSDKVMRRSKRPSVWTMAGGVAALALIAFTGVTTLERMRDGVVETVASEWHHRTLEDGTTVHMDARTRLKIVMTPERRVIHLLQGQAAFDVAKDARRPFVVKTPLADVIAVGTRFSVSLDTGVTTIVEEGVVKVMRLGQDDVTPILLTENEQLHIPVTRTPDVSVSDKVKVDAKTKLQWTTGWVPFDDTTVGEIVDQFNRRHVTQAKIESEELRNHKPRFTRVKIDSVEMFKEALDAEGGIAVIEDRDAKTLHLLPE
jgi:ferric-dicitrate binding protein FerR (iron transport regulator)